jgi:hypothetical protein
MMCWTVKGLGTQCAAQNREEIMGKSSVFICWLCVIATTAVAQEIEPVDPPLRGAPQEESPHPAEVSPEAPLPLPTAAANLLIELELFEVKAWREAAEKITPIRQGLIRKLKEAQAASQERGNLDESLAVQEIVGHFSAQAEKPGHPGSLNQDDDRPNQDKLPASARLLIDKYDRFASTLRRDIEAVINAKRQAVAKALKRQVNALTKSGDLEGALETKEAADTLLAAKLTQTPSGKEAAEINSATSTVAENPQWPPASIMELETLLKSRQWLRTDNTVNFQRTCSFLDGGRLKIEEEPIVHQWEASGKDGFAMWVGASNKIEIEFKASKTQFEFEGAKSGDEKRMFRMRPINDQ